MRIAEFHIEGFGCLERLSVTDLHPGLSLVLGGNEAGKSTLLAFLRAMLFGFPRRSAASFPPPHGSRQGGRLVLLDGHQDRITVERFATRSRKTFTATLRDGSQWGQDQLHQRLGRVTPDVYANVFAFGLGELQNFASLQDDKVRDAIYSAGMGTGKQSPAQRVQQLRTQSEQWFKPRGTVPEMNKILVRLERQQAELNKHAEDQDCYQQFHDQRRQAEQRRGELGAQVIACRQRLARLKTLSQARDDWVRLVAAREKIETLPAIPSFPLDGLARWDRLQTEQRAIRDELREAEDERRAYENQLAEVRIDSRLLDEGAEIRRLDRQLEVFEKNRRELAAAEGDRKLARAQFDKELERLGPEWDEPLVRAFDLSLPVQQEIARAQDAWRKARMQVDKQQSQVERLEQQLREQREAEEGERQRGEQLAAPQAELEEAGIEMLRRQQAAFDAARRELPQLKRDAQHQEARLRAMLRQIDPEWTETELGQFDASLPAQQALNDHRDRLSDLHARLRQAEDRTQTAELSVREFEQAVQRSQAELDRWPAGEADDESLRERKSQLNRLGDQLRTRSRLDLEIAHQEQRRQDFQDQLARMDHVARGPAAGLPVWLTPAIAGLGLAGFLLVGALREDWLLGALLLAIALGIAGLLYAVARFPGAAEPRAAHRLADDRQALAQRMGELDDRLHADREAHRECCGQIQPLAAAAGLESPLDQQQPDPQPLTRAIQQAEEQIERQQARNQQRRSLERQRDERQAQWERARATLQDARRVLAGLQQENQQAQTAWRAWLREKRLPETLSPDVARDVLAHVQSARELRQGLQEKRERITKTGAIVQDYHAAIRRVAANSRIDHLPDDPAAAVRDLSERLDQQQQLRRMIQEVQRRWEEEKRRTARAEEAREAAQYAWKEAQGQLDTAQRQWQDMLARHDLRETLTVEQIDKMLQAIRDAQKQLAELERQQVKEQTLAREMAAYQRDVQALLSRSGLVEKGPDAGSDSPPAGDADVAARVQSLARRLQQAEAAQRRYDTLGQSRDQAESRVERLRSQLEERQQASDQLLGSADVSGEEAFRRKARDHAQLQEFRAQIDDLETRLRLLAGSPEALDELQEELQACSPESLQTEQEQAEQTIDDLEQRRDEAVRESEQLRVRLEELERSEEISALRIRHEADLAEFRQLARQWAALQITAHLIDRAREQYERERRPAVLKQAERYFSQFTAGRYREIHTASDEPTVVAPDGERKTLSQLSRGTSEQLYLSLRFGYVEEFVQQSEPLPLIFDDILVNFDAERAAAAAQAIGELAQTQQILLFTCHRRTARLLKQAHPAAAVYQLGDGQLQPRDLPETGGAA